jgi:hypothetical protein
MHHVFLLLERIIFKTSTLFSRHLREHLREEIGAKANKDMSPDEMEFHYFRYFIVCLTVWVVQLVKR